MNQKFSIDEAIQYGWNTMKENIGFFIIVLIIVTVVQLVPSFVAEAVKTKMPVWSLIITLLSTLVNLVMGIGMIRIVLHLHDTQSAELRDLFSCGPALFFKYLLSSLLYGLIIAGMIFLLLIPELLVIFLGGKDRVILVGSLAALAIIAGGILLSWLMLKFQFYGYLIIDRNLGVTEALVKSSQITRGAKGQLLLLGLLLGLINIAGFLACFVGLFATVPLTMMAMVFVYRKLLAGENL